MLFSFQVVCEFVSQVDTRPDTPQNRCLPNSVHSNNWKRVEIRKPIKLGFFTKTGSI